MEVKLYKISNINPAKYNPRKITDEELSGLKESIKKFGFVEPLIVNKRTNTLVGGHQRLKAAEALGFLEIPVTEVDLSLAEEKALNIALNSPTIQGKYDNTILKTLIDEIKNDLKEDIHNLRLDQLYVDLNLDINIDDINNANENEEWVDMPEFKKGENYIKLSYIFGSLEARDKFISENNITVDLKKNENTWICYK